MAQNKKEAFAAEEIELAELAKALSHPARIAILKILSEKQTCICGELVEVLPLAQATVSQHLKELKAVGLIRGEVEGPRSCYCLDYEKMERLETVFRSLFQTIAVQKPLQNCC